MEVGSCVRTKELEWRAEVEIEEMGKLEDKKTSGFYSTDYSRTLIKHGPPGPPLVL